MSVFLTTKDHIAKYGHTVIGVPGEADLRRFSYTIGMTERQEGYDQKMKQIQPEPWNASSQDMA
jgi:hypothetical protein